jgi:hypothetical protein
LDLAWRWPQEQWMAATANPSEHTFGILWNVGAATAEWNPRE